MILTELLSAHILSSFVVVAGTITLFQLIAVLQRKLNAIWLQPMLVSILVTIAILLWQDISFESYFSNSWLLNALLEPAVVALGFPLYQHLETITKQWKSIILVLFIGAFIAISTSFIITMLLIGDYTIAVALSLKSVTTPIAIAIAGQLDGNTAITAFAIILAGFFGALVGPPWLKFIKVKSPKAQGLAIGAASHAIGTAIVSNISYEHAAYSSLALIVSAVITALISPFMITFLAGLI
ncbi:LrgB family protein [Colwellia sp. MB02u-10]|jgi:predicted murein hydrolase (TIGR00659 family)|uniref:LrgB family protein n=1 Tax=Colwellia sp. MB02u-10 TaxID=2759828 RepID=UPI0015F3D5A0|nr:LrgB family protein [Colwellia sp. MB02u-10]MBA6341860.1 LrgB family protein [Colwellia sp. MB02u-10]